MSGSLTDAQVLEFARTSLRYGAVDFPRELMRRLWLLSGEPSIPEWLNGPKSNISVTLPQLKELLDAADARRAAPPLPEFAVPEKATPEMMNAHLALSSLTDAERQAVLWCFCSHCGRKQPATGRSCQCWNDD